MHLTLLFGIILIKLTNTQIYFPGESYNPLKGNDALNQSESSQKNIQVLDADSIIARGVSRMTLNLNKAVRSSQSKGVSLENFVCSPITIAGLESIV